MSPINPHESADCTIHQAQEQFWNAVPNKDRQAFERLLAEDFVSRSPGQANQGWSEFIETLKGFPAQMRAISSDNLEVHVWGEVAAITGVQMDKCDSI